MLYNLVRTRAQPALSRPPPSASALPLRLGLSLRTGCTWDHRAACATSGVLALRALPLERAIAKVCEETLARLGKNVRLVAMTNPHVPVHDARRVVVVCNGPPSWHGARVAVFATIVSPIARNGTPKPRADFVPGAVLRNAANRKRRQTYPELERSRRCHLVVFGVEVLRALGSGSRSLPPHACACACGECDPCAPSRAWVQRWSGIISVGAQRAGDVTSPAARRGP